MFSKILWVIKQETFFFLKQFIFLQKTNTWNHYRIYDITRHLFLTNNDSYCLAFRKYKSGSISKFDNSYFGSFKTCICLTVTYKIVFCWIAFLFQLQFYKYTFFWWILNFRISLKYIQKESQQNYSFNN